MMWDFYTDGRNCSAPMASLHAMHEIHVLLVDHEPEALIHTAKQLELCHYRVTLVELASAAISMLLSGKTKFDVVIANINSPDLHGFKLLQQAVSMGLPIVLASVEDNAIMAMRALESGAFLYIKKPATMEILRYLWQLVMREKTRIFRERELFLAANNLVEKPAANLEILMNNNNNQKKKKKKKKADDEEEEEYSCDSENRMLHMNNVRKKMCTEWTHELHAKFMDAVETLGEGRCFPKEILELMNVPGLTRMQVASHLQKCRNDNWKSPEERKPVSMFTQITTNQNSSTNHEPRPRRFGSKPQLQVQTPKNNDSSITFTYHHKKYGSIGGASGPKIMSSNPRSHSSHDDDQFFNFGLRMDHPNPAPQLHKQNSETNMEGRSQWSSEFESDQSQTRGPNH